MSRLTHARSRLHLLLAGIGALLMVVFSTVGAFANVALTMLSSDPYTNTTSQHQTEVEPDSLSFGSTEVAAFQVGRFTNGGSSNIGYATSTNGGSTWSNGFLPGITVYAGGSYARATDPAVAYDLKHNVWLISTLGLSDNGGTINGAAVLASRSTDGGLTFGNPVATAIASGSQDFDKNWIVCDTHSASPFYGTCYQVWDDHGAGNLLDMSTSTDGGLTWGAIQHTPSSQAGIGEQPLVQPNGTLIVPLANANESAIGAYMSTNGGASYTDVTTITLVKQKTDPGSIRSGALPSAEIDGAGNVYVVWRDCRFQSGCKNNDIVMTTSSNGTTWSAVTRVTNDGAGVDHFIPGLAVDVSTSGSGAHLGLTYYYYPNSSCTSSTCQLDVGYRSSVNGGASWSAQTQLDGPMTLTWLANTTQGYMVGDYISTSIMNGRAYPVFTHATAPSGSTLNEYEVTATGGLGVTGGAFAASSSGASGVPSATMDHSAWTSNPKDYNVLGWVSDQS